MMPALVALAAWLLRSVPGDPLGPVDQNPDDIRETACRLVSPDAVCSPPPPPKSIDPPNLGWLETIIRVVALTGLALLVVVLVVLIARALRRRRPQRRHRRSQRDDGGIEALPDRITAIDRSIEPTDWRTLADEHRRAGRHRDALRCRYRAMVGDLARRGVIDEIPGRTTGEERAQIDVVAPDRAPPFHRAADLFDGAWYGRLGVDDADVEAMIELERTVLGTADVRR